MRASDYKQNQPDGPSSFSVLPTMGPIPLKTIPLETIPLKAIPLKADATASAFPPLAIGVQKKLSQDEWESFKPLIQCLYIEENKTFLHIAAVLQKEYGFHPTKRQFSRKVSDWGFKKNANKSERRFIMQNVSAVEDRGVIKIAGKKVSKLKLERWRKELKDMGTADTHYSLPSPSNTDNRSMDWERDPPSTTDSTKLNLDVNVHEGVRNEEGRGEPIPSLQMDVDSQMTTHSGLLMPKASGNELCMAVASSVPFTELDGNADVANLETDQWPFDRWANVDVLGSPKFTRLFENLKLESNSLDESFESFSLPDPVLLPATELVEKYIPSSELNLLRGDICLEATICLEETPWYQHSGRRKGKESKLMPFKYPADVWFPSGHFVPGWSSPLQEIYPFPGAPSSSTRGKKSTKQLIVTYQQYEVDFNHKLSQLKRVCDDTQPGVIETMDDLAYVYYAQNKLIQAEYWYRKVIAIRQQRNEDDSLSILYPQAMLAGVLCWLGRLKEANKMHQKTHSVIIRKLAPDNRLRKESFVVLARIAKELGKYEEAEAIFRQLVQINLTSFGPKHPETLDCISELAETIRKQYRYVESQKLQGIVVQLLLESRENSPAKLCLSMVYLGIALSCQMRLKEATSVFRLSLDTYNESLGDKHPVTMSCSLRLGSALRKQKHVRESEEILRATLRRSIGTLGDGHMLTGDVMYELGKTLELCGRHGEATGWLEKSFRGTLEIWGPETKDAVLGCDSLGWLYENQGRYREALALYEEFLDKVKNVGIDDNPAVASLSKWIASVRRKLREHGEDSEHGELSFS